MNDATSRSYYFFFDKMTKGVCVPTGTPTPASRSKYDDKLTALLSSSFLSFLEIADPNIVVANTETEASTPLSWQNYSPPTTLMRLV